VTCCFDITGAISQRDEVDVVTLDLARGCDDRDRFAVWTAAGILLLTPATTETLATDWRYANANAGDRARMASRRALGVVDVAWFEAEFSYLALVAPTDDLDHLVWWRRLATTRSDAIAAFFYASDRAADGVASQPRVGVGTYQRLVASLPRIVCVGPDSRRQLAQLAGRPESEFAAISLPRIDDAAQGDGPGAAWALRLLMGIDQPSTRPA
jgi:hypothetical protein